MSRQLVSREQLQRCAAQRHTWHDAAAMAPQIAALFGPQSSEFRTLDKRLVLGDEALRMLRALNDFDRRKVAEELLEVARHPNRLDADTGRKHWFQRLLPSRYPFRGYHYLIRYVITPGQPVVIVDIFLDRDQAARCHAAQCLVPRGQGGDGALYVAIQGAWQYSRQGHRATAR